MGSLIKRLKHIRFIGGKPRLAYRIAGNILNSAILNRPRLRNIQIALTYRCNFVCSFCSATTLNSKKKEMTLPEVRHIWDNVKRLGVVHVDLTGGEPTLRDDLPEIIRYIAKDKDTIVSIATNGFLMTPERVQLYKKAGLNSVFVSLHSMNPKVQDKISGVKGSYDKALQAMANASSAGLNVCINSVITSENFDDIKKIIDFAEKKDYLVLLEPIATIGRSINDSEDRKITGFYEEYMSLLRKHHVRADTTTNFRNLGSSELCPGGIEKWYITAYGEVLQCSFVQVTYGNLLTEDAKEIYRRMTSFPILCRRSKKCKHVFDEDFIRDWFDPIREQASLPLKAEEHRLVKGDSSLAKHLKKKR